MPARLLTRLEGPLMRWLRRATSTPVLLGAAVALAALVAGPARAGTGHIQPPLHARNPGTAAPGGEAQAEGGATGGSGSAGVTGETGSSQREASTSTSTSTSTSAPEEIWAEGGPEKAHRRHAHAQQEASTTPAAGGSEQRHGQHGGAQPGATAAPATPAGPAPTGINPNTLATLNPSLGLASPAASPLLEFFIGTFRTPPFLLPIYLAASERYGVPWQILAAINEVESDYGRDLSNSSAGAEGWMQFLPAEWYVFGVDANGAGVRDPSNPADAVFAAARYLSAAGAAQNLSGAIYAYNHSQSYVESVLMRAKLLAVTPQPLIDGLSAVVSGRMPVASPSGATPAPVWGSQTHAPGVPAHAGAPARSAGSGAVAPAPQVAAQGEPAGGGAPTVVGAKLSAASGAPVRAVQQSQLLRIGHDNERGRFIELRDAYGDIYTYGDLGAVAASLRKGSWLPAAAVIGSLPGGPAGGKAELLLEIRPAGAEAIDPRPLIEAWQLLETTQAQPRPGTQPLFGPTARDALVNEVLLMGAAQLQAHLLAEPRLHLDSCERHAIGSGDVDRRVLATLELLLDSGLAPSVSAPACATGTQGVASRDLVLSALNGTPVGAGGHSGALTELALQRLLALPGALKPQRIAAPIEQHGADGARAARGPRDAIDLTFGAQSAGTGATGPTGAGAASGRRGGATAAQNPAGVAATPSAAPLSTGEWRKLLARIAQVPEPQVSKAATSGSVPDTPASPAPSAAGGSPFAPVTGTERAAPEAESSEPARTPSTPARGPSGGSLRLSAPLLAAVPSDTMAGECSSGIEDVTLEVATPEGEPQPTVFEGLVVLRARIASTAGAVEGSSFAYSEAEAENWNALNISGTNVSTTGTETSIEAPFESQADQNGDYDLCVALTIGGIKHVGLLDDRLIANKVPVAQMLAPHSPAGVHAAASGSVPLEAVVEKGEGASLPPATFQYKPSIPRNAPSAWQTIAEGVIAQGGVNRTGGIRYVLPGFNTVPLADGEYDFRAIPSAAGAELIPAPARRVVVDNTAPQIVETKLPSSLSGDVTLSASAADPVPAPPRSLGCETEGSGVKSVSFERAPQGSSAFVAVGAPVRNPSSTELVPVSVPASCKPTSKGEPEHDGYEKATYPLLVHSEAIPNGTYEFRVTIVDRAGNRTSQTIGGIEIHNQPPPPINDRVNGVTPPAERVTMLGAIRGSANEAEQRGASEQETWAYGYTSAPPASGLNGQPLEYEQQGHQLVLLRYTRATGWQIADVLRHGAKAFETLHHEAEVQAIEVRGTMATSGEAWLWFGEQQKGTGKLIAGVFRRKAPTKWGEYQPFEYDEGASTGSIGSALDEWAKGPLGSLGVSFHLGEAEGQPYGTVTAPGQTAAPLTVPNPRGSGTIAIKGKLSYFELAGSEWEKRAAPVPEASEMPRSSPGLATGNTVTLRVADPTGPQAGWGALAVEDESSPLAGWGFILGRLEPGSGAPRWSFAPTGLDVLDLSEAFAGTGATVERESASLTSEGDAVWVGADVVVPEPPLEKGGLTRRVKVDVVARYERASGSPGRLVNSACSEQLGEHAEAVENHCEEPLGDAAVPEAVFPGEKAAIGVSGGMIHVFSHERWSAAPASGYVGAQESFRGFNEGGAAFTDARDGWLAGTHALGHWSPEVAAGSLNSWPVPDQFTLTSVAVPPAAGIPPGGPALIGEPGALAVGLHGTSLSYQTSLGWLAQSVPPFARTLNLLGVAFARRGSAFAVGQGGVILNWNGTSWSEDPGSRKLTRQQLNAVAFAPSGEGWAVGNGGTILHYNGTSWAPEPVKALHGAILTSVSASADEAFLVADGNLYERSANEGWHRVGEAGGETLPTKPPPEAGALRLVSALPDGGVVAAGRNLMLKRQAPGKGFEYAASPQGIAVALRAFREEGQVRAFVSVAPPAFGQSDVGGYPPGDGELLRETAAGWNDLSGDQYAGVEVGKSSAPDGALKPDPVLAITASPSGEHGWAVGGYAGTVDAAKQGTTEALSVRSPGWQTAAIWRYDIGGGAAPPALESTQPYIPAEESTVSFAFFSSPTCFGSCSATVGAQPDVNLSAAAGQIASFAAQPGGPSFVLSGGDVRTEAASQYETPSGGGDLAHMSELLSPLGALPVFSAIGPRDYTEGEHLPEGQAWGEAFAESSPPFGSGVPAGAITPVSSEAPTVNGDTHRYYSFDAHQNGGTLRVIVLDNSQGSLAQSAAADGQSAGAELSWLEGQITQAQQEEQAVGQHIPIVVTTALPLRNFAGTADGDAVASLLARRGVDAVFSGNPTQRDERRVIPEFPRPGEPQIPEYEGASLSYQQPGNNGVLWYDVSVNTQTGQLTVYGVPVVNQLALKPLDGLNVARSQTLQFEAVARRPAGSLATVSELSPLAPGFENYVAMPVSGCSQCVSPAYGFASSEPQVGQFVEASGPGSQFPKLNGTGHPIPSATSGLFCAYNAGTTEVSITTGLLTYTLPVTVEPGDFGPPCGTVPDINSSPVITILTARTAARNPGAAPPPPPPVSPAGGALPASILAPPPVAVAPAPAPPPPLPPVAKVPTPPPPAPPTLIEPTPPPPAEPFTPAPALVPTPAPPVEPIPPGAGATAQSPAERREKAEKEASESAFVLRRPAVRAGIETPSEPEWFYWGLGLSVLLAMMLSARGLRRPRARPALLRHYRPLPERRTRR